ncbi:hypothetical protein [uncultured Croceitalea sp.]|uniref:hypothetical protein n=1 Tax=uncultured Croceitalea sp. TaxID=1798908 RepID=UPI003305D949
MKKTIFAIILVLTYSCGSENLSNSKAEKILETCLEKNPEQRTASFRIGKATFRDNDYDKELLGKYAQLVEDGYLTMELVRELKSRYNKGKEYSIVLTEKALDFMEKVPEKGGNVKAKAFTYEVEEVLEVQEIPSLNTAKVKVKYKAENKTPFIIFYAKEPQDFWIDDLSMSKTSNGWKYCDNF